MAYLCDLLLASTNSGGKNHSFLTVTLCWGVEIGTGTMSLLCDVISFSEPSSARGLAGAIIPSWPQLKNIFAFAGEGSFGKHSTTCQLIQSYNLQCVFVAVPSLGRTIWIFTSLFTFQVPVVAPGRVQYSWHKDGQPLPRAGLPRLVLSGATDAEGSYTCVVTAGEDAWPTGWGVVGMT